MAIRVNLHNSVVTAGEFDPIKGDSLSLRQKIARLSSVISSSNLGAQLAGITSITSDLRITVAEKPILKKEWEYIKESYNLMCNTVEDMGLESTEQYMDFTDSFDSLENVMETVFSDMTKDTVLNEDIQVLISAYNQSATRLNNFLTQASNSLLRELSKYSLDVEAPLSINSGETITVNAIIRYFDEDTGLDAEISDEQKSKYEEGGLYPLLYIWNIKGTKNDEVINQYYRGRRSVTIKSTDLSGENVSVSFSSIITL